MNLRDARNYYIGLDIGTASVGWAVLDEYGNLYKFKGKNTWGSRLFDQANTAAETRSHRTQRRRYARRHMRIQNLREFLLPDIAKVDPEFFFRLNQSDLIAASRNFPEEHILFNGSPFSESEYYKRFPTIYHLRKYLVNSDKKEDIRLIYLALHHMMKYRGNFLIEGKLSAASANPHEAIKALVAELEEYCNILNIEWTSDCANTDAMEAAIAAVSTPRRDRQEGFIKALAFPPTESTRAKALANAVFGYKTEFSKIFPVEKSSDSNFALDNDEKVTKFVDEFLPDNCSGLFNAVVFTYNAYLLAGILKDAQGGTLSSSMVARYEDHKKDLAKLKEMVKKYYPPNKNNVRVQYNNLFRGPRYAQDGTYKKSGTTGYTGYILGQIKRDDFYTNLKKDLFKGVDLSMEDQAYWNSCQEKMDEGYFLPKLRTNENGAIPYQLHLEEMEAIINRQKKFYPTLAKNGDHIIDLLKFRIPYYVGPLGKETNPYRKKPFSWAIRKPGMETEPVRPWNFEDIIDIDASAEAFINNLTGECTYWLGKKVIPKNSLLYSEFCVLQELNVCKINTDGEKQTRITQEDVHDILEHVFKKKKKVRTADVEEHLKSKHPTHYHITGTQKENEFASSLGSYIDFKNILGREIVSYSDREMVETLITWATVFEDRKIFKRRINQTFGPKELGGNGALTTDQIKEICKKRYTGWSKLSREFLEELRVDYNGGRISIMDVLRDSGSNRPMNLMEILADKRYGFQDKLDELNQEFLKDQYNYSLDNIPGSPAIKRGINQSLKIVREIVSIVGREPAYICVEMAREDVGENKGKRTVSRYKQVKNLYAAITKDMEAYSDKQDSCRKLTSCEDRFDDERVYLYFLQCGKCAYSGKPLEINDLHLYHIDHIIPQSMVKDDSIDNKVLVFPSENERKLDRYPLPSEMRKKSYARWLAWKKAGLMSEKKFLALTTNRVSDHQAKGFINRQLVETRQISKHVVQLLQAEYPDTTVEAVKAALTHSLRSQYGFYKNRNVNDWHHAHDAYLACQISRFIHTRYPRIAEDLDYNTFTRYASALRKETNSHSGLIVNSFAVNGFDIETGEIKRDTWNGDFEIDRIRTCLNYKDCFISHKTEHLTGEFWNQTIYSHHQKTDKAIPIKKDKSPNHYGYYMGLNPSYYCVIEHTVTIREKRKRIVSMIGIPINIAYTVNDKAELLQYLKNLYEEPRLLKTPIPKYQKIEWDGNQYYLTSQSEMINARQLWLPQKYMQLLDALHSKKAIQEHENELSEKANDLFGYLCKQIKLHYPRYKNLHEKIISEKTLIEFENLTADQKLIAINEVLNVLHCNAERGMKKIKLSEGAGRMNGINFGNSISDITFIDTSVTGMFESRSHIEL